MSDRVSTAGCRVDGEDAAGDRAGFVGHQVDGERRDVVDVDEPAQRDRLQPSFDVAGNAERHRRLREARRDDIHADATGREFERQAAGNRMHTGLGRHVRERTVAGPNRERRSGREQHSPVSGEVRDGCAKRDEHAGQVDREYAVPVVEVEFGHRCGRNEHRSVCIRDMQRSEVGDEIVDCGRQCAGIRYVGHAHRARRPSLRTSPASDSSAWPSSPIAAMSAPSRAARSAVARPIPLSAPVMSTTRSANRRSCTPGRLLRQLAVFQGTSAHPWKTSEVDQGFFMAGTVLVEWQGRSVPAANPDPNTGRALRNIDVDRTPHGTGCRRGEGVRRSRSPAQRRSQGVCSSRAEGLTVGAIEGLRRECGRCRARRGGGHRACHRRDCRVRVADNLAVVTRSASRRPARSPRSAYARGTHA